MTFVSMWNGNAKLFSKTFVQLVIVWYCPICESLNAYMTWVLPQIRVAFLPLAKHCGRMDFLCTLLLVSFLITGRETLLQLHHTHRFFPQTRLYWERERASLVLSVVFPVFPLLFIYLCVCEYVSRESMLSLSALEWGMKAFVKCAMCGERAVCWAKVGLFLQPVSQGDCVLAWQEHYGMCVCVSLSLP